MSPLGVDTIDVIDIGNVCLNALNDYGQEWYLMINTELGWTTIKEFGPLLVDTDNIAPYFDYKMFQYEYSDKKIAKVIDKFINNQKRMITQVFEVSDSIVEERLNTSKKSL